MNLKIDEASGLYSNTFSVSIEEDNLVFDFRDHPRGDLSEMSESIDSGEVGRRFLDLTRNRRELNSRLIRVGDSSTHFTTDHVLSNQFTSPQYQLVDNGMSALLNLAQEMGPLFGQHGASYCKIDGSRAIEPIDWWIQGSAVYRLAVRIRSALLKKLVDRSLGDEVVFRTMIHLPPRKWSTFFELWENSEIVDCAFYELDGPLSPPYHDLLTVDPSSRARVHPKECEQRKNRFNLSYGDYASLDHLDFPQLRSLSQRQSAFKTKDARELENCLNSLLVKMSGPRWEEFLDAQGAERREFFAKKRMFACQMITRRESTVDNRFPAGSFVNYSEGIWRDPYILTRQIGSPGFEEQEIRMLERLYNTLVSLHTWRNSDDLRMHKRRAPFYLSALDHIWYSLGRSNESTKQLLCEICGKPLTGRQEKYCSETCSNAKKNRDRADARNRVDQAILSMEPETPFTARDISLIMGNRNNLDFIVERLETLKDRQGSPVKGLGGNGRGKRYVILSGGR